jgi:ABC-type glycerol-3-phosphate transport system substrate-binding protein
MKKCLLILVLICLSLGACSNLDIPGQPAPATPSEATPTIALTSNPAIIPVTPTPGPITLRIWLPPQFDPSQNNPASRLLQEQLDAFIEEHPGVRIDVRVKSLDGPGGLLDALSTANAAAPLALPDLILLPRAHLETAALKGLLTPFDGLSTSLNDDDWYTYAWELARLQDSTFGLPLAGDGQIMLYRPAEIIEPPKNWPNLLALGSPLIFPAADEQALFTLQQYLATGAPVQDADGRPTLDPAALIEVLEFFKKASAAGTMPFWLTQFTTDDQAWEAYNKNSGSLVTVPVSRYLQDLPGDSSATPIPTQDGKPFTLVDGWIWALSNPQPDRHELSVNLAEFLTSSEFLAEWSIAAGYLPPRRSALASWTNRSLRNPVENMVESAHILPSIDILAVISPALHQATIDVLKQESNPQTAAQKALELIQTPDSTP